MNHDIRYNQRYQTLLTVCSTGSFTSAGQTLGLTPSAVAQQVRSFERDLGIPLFDKKDNKLIPTKECELVCTYAQQFDLLYERMDSDLLSIRRRLSRIVIGMTGSIESNALSRMLTSYDKKPDHLQITLKTGSVQELEELLSSGAIDFAVSDSALTADSFSSILLDTDYLAVVVPIGSPLTRNISITLNQLQSERLILPPVGSGTRNMFDATLLKAGKSISDFNVMMEIDSISTIKNLIIGHHGLSVLSNKACEQEIKDGKLCTLPLNGTDMARNIRIYYRTDSHSDTLLRQIQLAYRSCSSETFSE